MNLRKKLALAAMAVGYVGAVGMLLILIVSHSVISDFFSYCGALVMLGLLGNFLFISANREIPILPHIFSLRSDLQFFL